MIPKYLFDTKQTCLNAKDISIKDKLLNYRELLYYNFKNDLKKFPIFKMRIINDYKIKVSEVDYQLTILKQKEINKKLEYTKAKSEV